jgi:hypothetical protein
VKEIIDPVRGQSETGMPEDTIPKGLAHPGQRPPKEGHSGECTKEEKI